MNNRKKPVGMPVNRRQMLITSGAAAGLLVMSRELASAADETATMLDGLSDVSCAYVDRATGKVVLVKSFAEVNPEVLSGETAAIPYSPPVQNTPIVKQDTLFRRNVDRFAIVDIDKRDEDLGFFSPLVGSYTPGEFTHHFLLTLADRELAREELGEWSMDRATDDQKSTGQALFDKVLDGLNGKLIREDKDKHLEATRYYTGRELLRPMLFVGSAPSVGDQAMVGSDGIRMASAGFTQLALASGAVGGDVSVGASVANDVSVAAKGATKGVSASGAAVGNAAAAGTSGGGTSAAGDGGGGSGGGSGGSGGGTGGAASGGDSDGV